MKFLVCALVFAWSLALSGCVVVIGNETGEGVYWAQREEHGIRHDGNHLSREVARVLAADEELVAEDLAVSSDDGQVVLKGSVRTVRMVERAMDRAGDVEGVTKVVSRITVAP